MEKITEFMIIMRDISHKYNIDEIDRTILERFVKNELVGEDRQKLDQLEKENKELKNLLTEVDTFSTIDDDPDCKCIYHRIRKYVRGTKCNA